MILLVQRRKVELKLQGKLMNKRFNKIFFKRLLFYAIPNLLWIISVAIILFTTPNAVQNILDFFQSVIDFIAPLFRAYGYAIAEYGVVYGIFIAVFYSLLGLACVLIVLFLIVILGGFLTAFFVPVLAIVFYINGVATIACAMMITASILASIGTFDKKLGILLEAEKEKEDNFDYSYSKEMEKYDVSILDKIKIGARNTLRWFLITTAGIVYFFILETKR